MNYNQTLDYLHNLGHETTAMKFGLRNTEILLAALDNPQRAFVKIQIAGTNGKGSTCAFLHAIARAANLRVGLFTSPHLIRINERIKINDDEISDDEFAEIITAIRATAADMIKRGELETAPTFFEHLTVAGLLAFQRAKVELAILETGLGGRLDSVTAARAEFAGITRIALDHQEYLGDRVAEIATEKAHIIHPQTRAAVIAPQEPEALQAIENHCRTVNITPIIVAPPVKFEQTTNDNRLSAIFTTAKMTYPKVTLALRGKHQLDNAALAVTLAEILGEHDFQISAAHIVAGLHRATHHGRLEFIAHQNRRFLLDGAHNSNGAQALREFLQSINQPQSTVIFGAMRDKDLREILHQIAQIAQTIILTKPDNPRAADLETLHTALASINFPNTKIKPAPTAAEAVRIAVNATEPDELIIITGSLYLIGEARQTLAFNRFPLK